MPARSLNPPGASCIAHASVGPEAPGNSLSALGYPYCRSLVRHIEAAIEASIFNGGTRIPFHRQILPDLSFL
jgi:hypothetical protein